MNGITPIPDRGAIGLHLEMLAERAAKSSVDLKLEIAWGEPNAGPHRARLFPVSQLRSATEFAGTINETGCNVYVGATLKKPDAPPNHRTGNQHAAIATCVAIDIDRDLVAGARKLLVRPQLLVLTGSTPSVRGHLWIGIEPTSDLELWDEVTSRAVALCDGDMGARGRSRVMRMGGTVNYPPERKQRSGHSVEPVRVHSVNAPIYKLAELVEVLPGLPALVSSGGLHPVAQYRPSSSAAAMEEVKSALAALPPSYADDHDRWLRIGFALHSFDAGPRGLMLWKQFSERNPEKAMLTDFDRRWSSFGRPCDRQPITIRSLFAQARAQGWRPQRASARDGRW